MELLFSRDFTKVSSALSINIGTALTEEWMQASNLAADAAAKFKKPWVLDPVGVGVTKHRTDHCVELMGKGPTVVRGNASEIMALVNVSIPYVLVTSLGSAYAKRAQ